MSVYDLVKRVDGEFPEREAVVYGDRRLDYREYAENIRKTAALLISLGVEKGDRIAILSHNCIEFLYTYLAAMSVGAVVVPLNPRYQPREVEYILSDSQSDYVFVVDSWQGTDYLGMVQEIVPRLPHIRRVVVFGDSRGSGASPFSSLLAGAPAGGGQGLEDRAGEVGDSDPATIIYTSGTTGEPKGAVLSQGNFLFDVEANQGALGIPQGSPERVLVAVPICHGGGGVLGVGGCLCGGFTMILTDTFNAQQALELIEKERVTFLGGVPAMFALMLIVPGFEEYDLSSLERGLMSAAPCPPDLLRRFRKSAGLNVFVSYGLTEAGMPCYSLRGDSEEMMFETVGKVIPGVDLRIVDEMRREIRPGELGEIATRGPHVSLGYYNRPAETAGSYDPQGWFYTGDMGTMDEEGYVRIAGRKKEMYIRGGYNVYPREVEEVIQAHPGVILAAVIGIPNEVLGERGRAYVMPRPGCELTGEEIKELCRKELADFKVPDQVIFRDMLPLTPVGKVKKIELQREIEEEMEEKGRQKGRRRARGGESGERQGS